MSNAPLTLDKIDRAILAELQSDASQPLETLAKKVGASKTPVWNRVRKLKDAGVIKKTTAIVDPDAVGLSACFFVFVQTSAHEKEWQDRFLDAVKSQPEVLEAHRLAGEIDYVLKIRVADARAYDAFYQRLISQVSIFKVTSTMSMEEIKNTTQIPVT
jgi:Lrp/AsnC family transcriptional regulator